MPPVSSVRLRIVKRYLECDVVDGGSCSVRPSITGTIGAVEQGEHLSVTTVAIRNLEECGVRKSGHKRQTDDLPVKLLHGVQIVNAKCDLAKAAHHRGLLVSGA